MYIILRRNGYIFAADGMYYVVVNSHGDIICRDMNKLIVEAEFMRLSC